MHGIAATDSRQALFEYWPCLTHNMIPVCVEELFSCDFVEIARDFSRDFLYSYT